MRLPLLVSLAVLLPLAACHPLSQSSEKDSTPEAPLVSVAGDPLVSTFSIVAVDTTTGEIGVAVQSKFPNVRSIVPWVEAGVGAVATQSFARLAYGETGLTLMRNGASAQEAMFILVGDDPDPASRQVGMVDAEGGAVTFTGANAFEWRGGEVNNPQEEFGGESGLLIVGDTWAAQGNILVSGATVTAMAVAFERAEGPLAQRLLAAIVAGGKAGGDKRGEQSAALVVKQKGAGYDGSDTIVDISVYDHPTPLAELQRLYALNDLYFTDSDPADMVPVTEDIARELQAMWAARGFYNGDFDGVVDAEFQTILSDYMGWENYDLRIDEVTDVDLASGETLKIDREVLEDMRAVFRDGRYR